MSALPPVCILAGGRGTRLGSRVAEVPKPLLEVAGEPFLLHQLRLLAEHGAERVVLCVGYLGDVIERTIGKERFGITIKYRYDGDHLRGTLGAVRGAADLLDDCFLILYGDTYLRVDYAAASENWRNSGCLGLMTVLRNEGRWDASNAVLEHDRVVSHDKEHPTPKMHWIDYGLGGLRQAALSLVGDDEQDLSVLYRRLATEGELFGFEAHERFYEIGSPESLQEAEEFLGGQAAGQAT
jgi:MurNAc alpha-1-phosphate uridylyltransferase